MLIYYILFLIDIGRNTLSKRCGMKANRKRMLKAAGFSVLIILATVAMLAPLAMLGP
jgi:predicted nucleic acid-binding Zn ribbon protein